MADLPSGLGDLVLEGLICILPHFLKDQQEKTITAVDGGFERSIDVFVENRVTRPISYNRIDFVPNSAESKFRWACDS